MTVNLENEIAPGAERTVTLTDENGERRRCVVRRQVADTPAGVVIIANFSAPVAKVRVRNGSRARVPLAARLTTPSIDGCDWLIGPGAGGAAGVEVDLRTARTQAGALCVSAAVPDRAAAEAVSIEPLAAALVLDAAAHERSLLSAHAYAVEAAGGR